MAMRHHQHAGIAGSLSADGTQLTPHPDLVDEAARLQVWVPLPDAAGREVDALEALTCVATRPGAARVVAVPHVATDIALGDELAIGDWDGEPMARGPLASSLAGTVRIVGASETDWRDIAALVTRVVASVEPTDVRDELWFDVMGDSALAASVPRPALGVLFAELADRAQRDELRWEYATPTRHL